MECVEEVINIPMLLERLNEETGQGRIAPVMDEIVAQSKVEFNYRDEEDDGEPELNWV